MAISFVTKATTGREGERKGFTEQFSYGSYAAVSLTHKSFLFSEHTNAWFTACEIIYPCNIKREDKDVKEVKLLPTVWSALCFSVQACVS